ncbi:peptidoglycan editing factor PgeF [Paenisporosarcina cavernae]
MKMYRNDEQFLVGITLKDETQKENNNIALHACESKEDVLENRNRFAESICYPLSRIVFMNQTHSANFYEVSLEDAGRGSTSLENAVADTDCLFTKEKDIVLVTFVADCVPVMFTHEEAGIIGVIHSGWQGTVKEITRKVFTHLVEKEDCSPEGFQVVLGPALSQEKFEVDADVSEKFRALGYADNFISWKEESQKYHIDNQSVVKKQLELCGLSPNQITLDRTCTFQSAEGFSYREDKRSGRHGAFVLRKS